MLAEYLSTLADRIIAAPRKKSPIENQPINNSVYVKLIVANGMAKAGLVDHCLYALEMLEPEIRKVSTVAKGDNFVHNFLISAFKARAKHSLLRLSDDTPLPSEIITIYNKGNRVDRIYDR